MRIPSPAELEPQAPACLPPERRAPLELLPLPLLPEAEPWRHGAIGCRRTKQRVGRRFHEVAEANDAIRAVSWCYGASQASGEPPSSAQREAISHILAQVRGSGPPPPDLDPQAAWMELLGCAAGYDGGGASTVAPYDKDLLSLPKLGAAPTPLSEMAAAVSHAVRGGDVEERGGVGTRVRARAAREGLL